MASVTAVVCLLLLLLLLVIFSGDGDVYSLWRDLLLYGCGGNATTTHSCADCGEEGGVNNEDDDDEAPNEKRVDVNVQIRCL